MLQAADEALPADGPPAQYVLGPHDQIALWSVEAEDLSGKTVQIDNSGTISIPFAGRVRAAGMTAQQLERELAQRLAPYILRPDVSVTVVEYGSQPVSVIGAVNNPGVHQLRGRRTLVEVLALAGGLKPEAGHAVKVTRRLEYGTIPTVKGGQQVSDEGTSIAEVNLRDVLEARNEASNIAIRPHDVISVPTAQMVYVVGEVTRPGGFVLNERETMPVLEALSLAGGLSQTASPNSARILRVSEDSAKRVETPVDLKRILSGKEADASLRAQDILFVPSSRSKTLSARAVEMVVQTLSGVLIFRSAR